MSEDGDPLARLVSSTGGSAGVVYTARCAMAEAASSRVEEGDMSVVDDQLVTFVRDALVRGSSREEIKRVLASAGWPDDEVAKALAAYAEVDFPIPVPRPRPNASARDAFVYLVLFTTLGVSACYFGSLTFELIARAFPDVADGATDTYRLAAIRQAVAALIVAFPIYLLLSFRVSSAIKKDPTKRSSKIRKWLTYLTLFVAARRGGCGLGHRSGCRRFGPGGVTRAGPPGEARQEPTLRPPPNRPQDQRLLDPARLTSSGPWFVGEGRPPHFGHQ